MTKREMILNALFARLKTLDVVVKRNEIAPQKIPASGLVIMRDGKQGVPEILLSPPICLFNHEAEVEVIVQAVKSEDRDKLLDELLEKIGELLSSDVNLTGLTDFIYPKPPEIIEDYIEGAPLIKAAVIPVVLQYSTINALK